MNKNALICKNYEISRNVNDLVRLRVEFILPIRPNESEQIAQALKNVELLLGSSSGINLVQGADRPRCSWCGVLHNDGEKTCSQCGGAL